MRAAGAKVGFRKAVTKRLKRVRRSLYPVGVDLAKSWALKLSDRGCQRWAGKLGRWAYFILGRERERTFAHLRLALGGELSEREIRRIALRAFQNLAMTGLELLRMDGPGGQRILEMIEVKGWEHVQEARERGKGGIFVTGHMGNWELCAAYVAFRGLPMNVVARRIYVEALDRELVSMRTRMGVRTLYRDRSMRIPLRCLKRNEFLGILPDQDVRRVGGMFVEFFGKPAYTPVGPALLALASGAPLLLARDIRQQGKHLITVDPPIYPNLDSPRDEEVRRLVCLYTHRLEQFVREHPDQWAWMHRRWRTRPEDVRLRGGPHS